MTILSHEAGLSILKNFRLSCRNPLFISTIGAMALLAFFVLSLDILINWQVNTAIQRDALTRAENWAENYVRTTPQLRRMIEDGITTHEEILRLESSLALVDVTRFRLFDNEGMLVHMSDTGLLDPSEFFSETALHVFETGNQAVSAYEFGGNETSARADTFIEVSLPVVLTNGDRVGALEVHVNVSSLKTSLEGIFQNISQYLVAGTVLVLLAPTAAYAYRTNQVMRKDKELLELTRYDQLTNVLNRNAASAFLGDHFRAPDTTQPTGFLFVDLDCFKMINDHFGHAYGDKILRHVANVLQSSIDRSSDIVARYGGDEFIVVCPGANRTDLQRLCRSIVTMTSSPSSDLELIPGLSIGTYVSQAGDTAAVALHRADLAVYAAKRKGRAQVVEYSTQLEGLFEKSGFRCSA